MGFLNSRGKRINKKPAKYSGKLDESSQQITLNEDLFITDSSDNIDLKAENVIIEGNGHTISADNVNHIFAITSQNVLLKNILFKDCLMKDSSPLIKVDADSTLTMESCFFESNDLDGHIIVNSGKIIIKNTAFKSNSSNKSLICSKGDFIFENSEFVENELKESACAIHNFGKLNCINSKFYTNSSIENLIVNEDECEIVFSAFENNFLDVTVSNNGNLSVLKSEFSENRITKANVYNSETCNMDHVQFDSNILENGFEIYNVGELILNNMSLSDERIYDFKITPFDWGAVSDDRFEDDNLAEWSGHRGYFKPSAEPEGMVKKKVQYSGISNQSVDEATPSKPNVKDDHYLNALIMNSSNILLNENISIRNPVTIRKDNVVIDGNGHVIEGNGKDRIFHVKARNVVLKNITFKNAKAPERMFASRKGYGGAIINEDELELVNCEFINNLAKRGGHDILNIGDLKLEACRFHDEKGGYAVFNVGSIKAFDSERNDLEQFISTNGNVEWVHDAGEHLDNVLPVGYVKPPTTIKGIVKQPPTIYGVVKQPPTFEGIVNYRPSFYKGISDYNGKDEKYIYFSFDVEDLEIVRPVLSELNHKGFNIAYNMGENSGEIAEIIRNSSLFVTLITKGIINRGDVRETTHFKELSCALKQDKEVLPVFLEDVELKGIYDFLLMNKISLFKFYYGNEEFIERCIDTFNSHGIRQKDIHPDARKGIYKQEDPFSGIAASSFNIYLSYDDDDWEFVDTQMKQYENQGIDFDCNDTGKIPYSSLVVAFISRNSNQSLDMLEDVRKASHHDKRILLIYIDDVLCDFADKLGDSRMFSIYKYRLSELEYIDRYKEIFQLYGFKSEEIRHPEIEPIVTPQPVPDALTFTDLNNLVQNNSEITLDSDVYLIDSEAERFETGIDINRDGLTVNGNGHSIFAKDLNKIFNINSKNITFKNLNFRNCQLKGSSAIIFINDDSSLTLDKCNIESNDLDDGHAIYTLGDIKITKSVFENNRSQNEGPAIFARAGNVKIESVKFSNNSSENSGGAILNWGRLNIKDSLFTGNSAEGYGGAIGNVIDAELTVKSTQFTDNHAAGEGCAIYSENRIRCESCDFTNHTSKLSLVFNETRLEMFNCNFNENSVRIIIQNNENGILYLSNSKLSENEVSIANVYNNGESASLEKVKFKNNKAVNHKSASILNETYMRLREPQLDGSGILNLGHIDIWKCDSESINNEGSLSVMDEACDKEFSFSWLDRQISKSSDNVIKLENNIKLKNCELEFYEGGIEIMRDNLTIDGQGHYIDGARRTSIFTVLSKNVTLKNILFKNAYLTNDFEGHITGGSAIRTVTGSSLNVICCEFKDNKCEDDGGAILNRSKLYVKNSRFLNNSSAGYGGAIFNRDVLVLDSNEFVDNKSRIRQDILNAGKLVGNPMAGNVYDITTPIGESDSFSFLAAEISRSDEIILNQDIMFDYMRDHEFKCGIRISDRDALTIDGRGFQINGDDRASFFNIKNSNVVFKNIIFKNAYCPKSSAFENDGEMLFEDCIFIFNRSAFGNALINNDKKITFKRCKFINNISKNESQIVNNHQLHIIKCEFGLHSNEKPIITNNRDAIVEKTKFLNNHSNENAAAIRNQRQAMLSVEDSLFKCNSTSTSGGAIINQGDIRLRSCELESNFAEGDGGAINNEKNATLEIQDSRISNNSSKGDGGAIINWGNLRFENSAFTKNASRKDGGAVNVQKGSLKIFNSLFDGNDAFDGGAIFNRGDLDILYTKFTNDAAKKDGGALNTYEGDVNISESLFKSNNAEDGGALYSREGSVHISGSEFDSNSAGINGGAIIKWCEMTIENSKFLKNSSAIYGGAINNQTEQLTVTDCEMSKNTADTGGAIFNVERSNLEIDDCRIDDNSPDDIY